MIQLYSTVSFTLVMLVFMSGVMLWWRALRRVRQGLPILAAESHDGSPWGLIDLLLVVGFHFFIFSLCATWMHRTWNLDFSGPLSERTPSERQIYIASNGICSLLAFLVSVAWLAVRHGARAKELGVSWRRMAADIRLGAAAFAMLAPIVYSLQFLLVLMFESKHPLIQSLQADPSLKLFLWCTFTAVLVAPISEEFFFRLLIQGWFERISYAKDGIVSILWGGRRAETAAPPTEPAAPASVYGPQPPAGLPGYPTSNKTETAQPGLEEPGKQERVRKWLPVLGSSLVFSLSHASHGPDPIPLFVLAMGLGYLYSKTGSIIPCIAVHFLLNLTSMSAQALALFQ